MRDVRDTIMTDARFSECIKYRAPAFVYEGLFAYFHWSSKKHVTLIFPNASSIPGDHQWIDGSGVQKIMRFVDRDGFLSQRKALLQIAEAWCISRKAP